MSSVHKILVLCLSAHVFLVGNTLHANHMANTQRKNLGFDLHTSTLNLLALKGGSSSSHGCPDLNVIKSTEKIDDDGRSVEFLVEVDHSDPENPKGAGTRMLTQDDLDAFIAKGLFPSLTFADYALASRFQDCQRMNISVSLRLRDSLDLGIGPSADREDEKYFSSYSKLEVHELMLKDRVRSEWYLNEIRTHSPAFAGKAVLDVGAGTGLLSLALASAGARRVYGVEASAVMARIAAGAAEVNRLSDRVSILHGRAEDVAVPEPVDAVVSEWMGFYLLHESMIHSVIAARVRPHPHSRCLQHETLLLRMPA